VSSPRDCRFSQTHEWFRTRGDEVTVGITLYAADELTDVTFVEMRPPGTVVRAGEPLGEVESVKTTSEVYTAVPGEIVEVNEALQRNPALVNSDPFGAGWLVKIRADDLAPLKALMDHSAYDARHPVGG
jgi:glycine cleavage system H protein